MTDAASINGDDFLRASKALKAAAPELRKQLNKRIRDAAKPLVRKTKDTALRTLPSTNGLNRAVAGAPQRVQVRTGQKNAGVSVVVGRRRGSAAAAANEGTVRHPVFGRPGTYVEQKVTPGWFDDTMKREAPGIKPDVQQAVADALDYIAREGS